MKPKTNIDAKTLYIALETFATAWKENEEAELKMNEKYYKDPGKAGLYTGRIEGMERIIEFARELVGESPE